jgi:hypothetical protein
VITADPQVLSAEVARLVQADEIGPFGQELAIAGEFVFRFGALGEIFDEPELTRAQFAGRQGGAWYLMGHWSVARKDPNTPPNKTIEELCHPSCQVCSYLEKIHGLRAVFEYEYCGECGGDIDVHAVALDPIGLPHAMCCGRWQRVDPAAAPAADVCAEQVSDAFNTRWYAPLADGTYAVVTRTYYVADRDGRAQLERDDRYQIVRDPGAPSDTEIESAGVRHQVDSDDPAGEDLEDLATNSFPPDPGEWQIHGPDSEPFANATEK